MDSDFNSWALRAGIGRPIRQVSCSRFLLGWSTRLFGHREKNNHAHALRCCYGLELRLEAINRVDTAKIVRELDAEIERLTSARKILSGSNGTQSNRSTKRAATAKAVRARQGNRLSAAGRKKLSQLMKKRWAERKKQAGSKAK